MYPENNNQWWVEKKEADFHAVIAHVISEMEFASNEMAILYLSTNKVKYEIFRKLLNLFLAQIKLQLGGTND